MTITTATFTASCRGQSASAGGTITVYAPAVVYFDGTGSTSNVDNTAALMFGKSVHRFNFGDTVNTVSFASHSGGAATLVTIDRDASLPTGTPVIISGQAAYNGTHSITYVSQNSFSIPVAFGSDIGAVPIQLAWKYPEKDTNDAVRDATTKLMNETVVHSLAAHLYLKTGTYTVKHKVKDSSGAEAQSANITINVVTPESLGMSVVSIAADSSTSWPSMSSNTIYELARGGSYTTRGTMPIHNTSSDRYIENVLIRATGTGADPIVSAINIGGTASSVDITSHYTNNPVWGSKFTLCGLNVAGNVNVGHCVQTVSFINGNITGNFLTRNFWQYWNGFSYNTTHAIRAAWRKNSEISIVNSVHQNNVGGGLPIALQITLGINSVLLGNSFQKGGAISHNNRLISCNKLVHQHNNIQAASSGGSGAAIRLQANGGSGTDPWDDLYEVSGSEARQISLEKNQFNENNLDTTSWIIDVAPQSPDTPDPEYFREAIYEVAVYDNDIVYLDNAGSGQDIHVTGYGIYIGSNNYSSKEGAVQQTQNVSATANSQHQSDGIGSISVLNYGSGYSLANGTYTFWDSRRTGHGVQADALWYASFSVVIVSGAATSVTLLREGGHYVDEEDITLWHPSNPTYTTQIQVNVDSLNTAPSAVNVNLNQTQTADPSAFTTDTAPSAVVFTPIGATIYTGMAQGTLVGTLSATGGEAPYVYSFVDNLSNKFQISGNQLQVGSTGLTAGTLLPNIRVTDENGAGEQVNNTVSVYVVVAAQDRYYQRRPLRFGGRIVYYEPNDDIDGITPNVMRCTSQLVGSPNERTHLVDHSSYSATGVAPFTPASASYNALQYTHKLSTVLNERGEGDLYADGSGWLTPFYFNRKSLSDPSNTNGNDSQIFDETKSHLHIFSCIRNAASKAHSLLYDLVDQYGAGSYVELDTYDNLSFHVRFATSSNQDAQLVINIPYILDDCVTCGIFFDKSTQLYYPIALSVANGDLSQWNSPLVPVTYSSAHTTGVSSPLASVNGLSGYKREQGNQLGSLIIEFDGIVPLTDIKTAVNTIHNSWRINNKILPLTLIQKDVGTMEYNITLTTCADLDGTYGWLSGVGGAVSPTEINLTRYGTANTGHLVRGLFTDSAYLVLELDHKLTEIGFGGNTIKYIRCPTLNSGNNIPVVDTGGYAGSGSGSNGSIIYRFPTTENLVPVTDNGSVFTLGLTTSVTLDWVADFSGEREIRLINALVEGRKGRVAPHNLVNQSNIHNISIDKDNDGTGNFYIELRMAAETGSKTQSYFYGVALRNPETGELKYKFTSDATFVLGAAANYDSSWTWPDDPTFVDFFTTPYTEATWLITSQDYTDFVAAQPQRTGGPTSFVSSLVGGIIS